MKHPVDHIFEHTPDSLADWCRQRGMPAFRAKQILAWVYQRGVADPGAMTNLSTHDRRTLSDQMAFLTGQTVVQRNAGDGVKKILVQWDQEPEKTSNETAVALHVLGQGQGQGLGGENGPCAPEEGKRTECVMIPAMDDGNRKTACISSQVGCPVGCRFCASGMLGLGGNLSAGRIVEQAWRLGRLQRVGRITNVVFMGMGEPLANFSPVVRAVRTIAAPWGMGISARKITVSTVGLPAAIERLAAELDLPVTLALSLHAPNDELRRTLIPWASYTTVEQLLAACTKWFQKTGREVTIEYTLLGGVNDRPEHARQLVGVMRERRGSVNLIRYNEVDGTPYKRPETDDVLAFQQILREGGVNTHIRASRGRDIEAACGQLRRKAAAG